MGASYWIKLYLEVLEDPKMGTLPDSLWRRFIELCLLAGKEGRGGNLPDTQKLAWVLRMDNDKLQADIEQLAQTGMIQAVPGGWFVVNFAKRQEPVTGKERVAQYREKQKRTQYYNNDVTETKRNVTQINRLTESEEGATSTAAANSPYIRAYKTILSITSWTAIPVGNDEQISIMQSICNKHGEGALEYCRPYYDEYRRRYPKSNRLGWVDWAATGQIPESKQQPKRGGMLRMEV